MFDLYHEVYEAFVTIPDAFGTHEVDMIRKLIENTTPIQGVVGTGTGALDKSIRDSRVKWLLDTQSEYHWIFQRIASVMREANDRYFGMNLKGTEGIQLTEYDSVYAGFYGTHIDASYAPGASRTRKLSLTMQLSDPSEYEGGDLKLYVESLKNPVLASKQRGAITLFRSHILHEVVPVTKGKRYSMVTWCHGPLRDR